MVATMSGHDDVVRFEGLHCTMEIRRPCPGLVVLAISGHDIGELGAGPFDELEADVGRGAPVELFIDARSTRGASMGVSNDWAQWLRRHRAHFRGITMLTGSRFIHMTAEFVRRFNDMGELMRITTDHDAFDEALREAQRQSQPRPATTEGHD